MKNKIFVKLADFQFDLQRFTDLTLSTDENGNYLIGSVADLQNLAAYVNDGGNTSGKTFKFTTNIKGVDFHIGTADNKFKGTFDGNGNKITVNYNTSTDNCALFNYVDGATIQNLTVDGTITTSAKYSAGLIANSSGTTTIDNCISSITINSTLSSERINGINGGFVAKVDSGTLNISNSIFDGKFIGENTACWGGFVGYKTGTVNISDSLFAPAKVSINYEFSGTFVAGNVNPDSSQNNCYTYLIISPDFVSKYNQGGTFVVKGLNLPENVTAEYMSGESVTFGGETYYKSGTTFKITVSEAARATFEKFNGVKNTTLNDDGTFSYTVNDTADVELAGFPKIAGLTFYQDGEFYEISTAEELQALATYVNAGNDCYGLTFKQTANIDLSGIENWTPIGKIANFSNPNSPLQILRSAAHSTEAASLSAI